MLQSANSYTIPTQSSGRVYFIKKKRIQSTPKQVSNYFQKQFNQQNLISINPQTISIRKNLDDHNLINKDKFKQKFDTLNSMTSIHKDDSVLSLIQSRISKQQKKSNKPNIKLIKDKCWTSGTYDSISKQLSRSNNYQNHSFINISKNQNIGVVTSLAKQNSYISLFDSRNKSKLKKKYVFQTICDQNFQKRLKRSQILIQQPTQQNKYLSLETHPVISKINSQNLSFTYQKSIKLPRRDRNSSIKQTTLIVTPSDGQTTQTDNQFNSRVRKSLMTIQNQNTNNSYISNNYRQTLDQLCQSVKNKRLFERMGNYQNKWHIQKQRRLRQGSFIKNIQKSSSVIYNRSLLQKSQEKSLQISQNFNHDSKLRSQKCNWEQQLRMGKKKYMTIGQPAQHISKLRGYGRNQKLQIQVKPIYSMNTNKYLCDQVYKVDKS